MHLIIDHPGEQDACFYGYVVKQRLASTALVGSESCFQRCLTGSPKLEKHRSMCPSCIACCARYLHQLGITNHRRN